VNIIAGSLGIGKTTTINHLLQHRPPGEQWAVLVNEYGLVGLDAALMEGGDASGRQAGVDVREVAGGCICCSAEFMFEVSLALLLQRQPDRLLIEPTGLAALSGILDTLDREGFREGVDVRSIVCLIDPARLDEALRRDETRDQIDAADVVLASRSDLASPDQLEAFESWAHELFPPKRHVEQVEHGRVAPDLLDLITDREHAPSRTGHPHGTDHHHHDAHSHDEDSDELRTGVVCDELHPIVKRIHRSPQTSTLGWFCWDGLRFDSDRAESWLRELTELSGARRIKAVLRTTDGWWSFNYADGVDELRPSGYRRDSRLEVVIDGEQCPDADTLEQGLRACLAPSPAAEGGAEHRPS
jgi:G3E family GTPase